MTTVRVCICTMNHYEVEKTDDGKVQIHQYDQQCPKMSYDPKVYENPGPHYTGKELLAEVNADDDIIFEVDPGGHKPEYLVLAGKAGELEAGSIECGDDFIHFFERVQEETRYKLWVDDQLDDPDQPQRWIPEGYWGAKTPREAEDIVAILGPPGFMDLDCDLGEDMYGQPLRVIDFLKCLQEEYPDNPPDWQVHSENRVAAEAVDSFMRSWHKVANE